MTYRSTEINIANSTLNNNYSSSPGGAIFVVAIQDTPQVDLNLINTTISGNTAPSGGGISLGASSGNVTMNASHVTIANNNGWNAGGGISSANDGGTVDINLSNAIVADNSQESNQDDIDYSSSSTTVMLSSSLVEVFSNSNNPSGSYINDDPQLGSLQDNGGPTQTMAPADGSPAINGGTDSIALTTYDQRGVGYMRYRDTAPDIGAVEKQSGKIHLSDSSGGGSSAFNPLWLLALFFPSIRRKK